MNDKAIRQYLQHYAAAETAALTRWPTACRYHYSVLIPAYQEATGLLHTILQAPWFRPDVLLILVINQPEHAAETSAQHALHRAVQQSGTICWQANNLMLIAPQRPAKNACGHILLVDRFTHPLPDKQGVGLARKIGADLALALIEQTFIQVPWICSTDADAHLPADYFTVLATLPNDAVAACYDFTHVAPSEHAADQAIAQATRTYEQALRYYNAGLHYAGSPYAHFSLGSLIACTAKAYAQVRGFPKRAAGEDFYLLNKLAKLGKIARAETCIHLQARLSTRVPFGTGVSAAYIMQLNRAGTAFDYYHPQVFEALRSVLLHCQQLWAQRAVIDQWFNALPPASAQALRELGLAEAVYKWRRQSRNTPEPAPRSLQTQKAKQQFERQFVSWFDGLKTLRFIHLLRANAYPNLPLSQAIQQAPFNVALT